MKDNMIQIDLGSLHLTPKQRNALQAAIHKTVVSKLKNKSTVDKKTASFSTTDLLINKTLTSVNTSMSVEFDMGVGKVDISVNNKPLCTVSQTDKNITLNGMNPGDIISVDGSCNGTSTIIIQVPTTPSTPQNHGDGPIHYDFDIN